MSGRTVSIPCPNCRRRIEGNGACAECGLDATLLFAIRRTAERLARQSAQRAGEGEWQEAYDAAEESLRLMANDNDLAAFVLLASTLAGARGAVRKIARPNPECLPAELRAPLAELLETTAELWSLLRAEDDDEAARQVRELQERHLGLGLFGEVEAPTVPVPVIPVAAVPPPPRPWRRALTAAVAATVLFALLGGWFGVEYSGRRGLQERTELERRLRDLEGRLQERPAPPPSAMPQDPWLTAWAALDRPAGASGAQASEARAVMGRVAWNRGLAASRAKRYKEATGWLELAIQAPRESYYRNDALYYLAKAFHRVGEKERAAELYQRVVREAPPGSKLVPEAQRLLARLQRGERVDG